MKMNLNELLIGVFCLTLYASCSGTSSSPIAKQDSENESAIKDTNYQKMDYKTAILEIDKKSENSGTWETLFTDKDFINIYEHSSLYTDSAIKFLADKNFSVHQKTVCVYSMQRANLEDYIRVFELCTNLFKTGDIPELLISRVISPTFGKRKPIVENYNNEVIKKLLEDVRDSQKSSKEFKQMIGKILTGEYWNNIKKFTEEN